MLSLNYKILGEGPPIIILHGLFGMLDNWQSFGKRLSENGYMAILIDQRDHGKSPFSTDFNYSLLSEDLYRFMESNWIFRSSILGHSMGGKTAMKFALDHEDHVEKLIILDIAPKAYQGGHELVFKAILTSHVENSSSRDEIYTHFKSILGDDEGTIQFLLKNLTRKKTGGYEWKFNVDNLFKNYKNILSEINSDHFCDLDTLFIRGGKSTYILDSDLPNIKTLFPNSQLETIPNAGHWVHADKSEELLLSVLSFLNKV